MKLSRRSISSVLILLLVLGPLQVQQAFSCSMMKTTFYGHCCCDQDSACHEVDCGEKTALSHGSCCNESIELDVNYEIADDLKTIKSYQIHSSVDPPAQILAQSHELFQVKPAIIHTANYTLSTHSTGSLTYLTTQRLRI